jgi:hypothetical protein
MSAIARIIGDPRGLALIPDGRTPILRVLDLARWAPSGDNTQVWTFRVHGALAAEVTGRDTRDQVLYDREGEASHLALGALVESARIAASGLGLELHTALDARDPRQPVVSLQLRNAPGRSDPLLPWLTRRATQRRALSTRAPAAEDRAAVEQALAGSGYRLRWFTGLAQRWAWARLWWDNAGIRLRCPEAYPVHRDIVDWHDRMSPDRVPAEALGASLPIRLVMRWALGSWRRVDRLNRWAAGTVPPRLELDLLPALRCGAHVALVAERRDPRLAARLAAGAAVQRLWLAATARGLRLQPAYTPLVFAAYDRADQRFTAHDDLQREAHALRLRLERMLGADDAGRTVFLARLGYGPEPVSRSTRLPIERLVEQPLGQEAPPPATVGG